MGYRHRGQKVNTGSICRLKAKSTQVPLPIADDRNVIIDDSEALMGAAVAKITRTAAHFAVMPGHKPRMSTSRETQGYRATPPKQPEDPARVAVNVREQG